MKNFNQIRNESLEEVLKASDPAGKWIDDFVHSKNPKFAGKSKEQRIRMALGASYGAKNEESEICSICEYDPCICDEGHGFVAEDHVYTHKVVHNKTGNVVGKYTSLKAATRAADKKDSAYGAVAHRVDVIKEAVADKGEYDYEGQMARTQLQTTMRNCQDLIGMIEDGDNMPEWVQSKITLAQDYITTVRDYLQSKEELGEDKMVELGDLAVKKALKHRVLVTYSDPNHPMVSQRKEKQQKHLRIPSTNKQGETIFNGDAIDLAKQYVKKQGLKVHDAEHIGLVNVNEDWKKKAAGMALAGTMALGAAAAHAGNLADRAAHGLYHGATSSVVGSIHKEKNDADLAFADKIPHAGDKEHYTKAVKSIIRSRNDSVMRHLGSNSTASRGSITVDERKFNRLKTELSQKHNIPISQVKEQSVAEGAYNPDTFVGKKGTYKGYGITQEGPSQWGISSSARKFPTLNATKRHIDKNMSEGVAEGVAETLPMDDAVKVLRQHGADHFKTTSNELHFYKQGKPFSVRHLTNKVGERSVNLSHLNSATRRLKGQGVAEAVTYEPSPGARPNKAGHTLVGFSFHSDNTKHANIMKHGETGKYYAAGGSSSHPVKSTTFHDTPEEAAKSKKSYVKESAQTKEQIDDVHKTARYLSAKEGVVQHVNKDPDTGEHHVSDWYHHENTVATYNNGRKSRD
jgi:hypothetical protein